MLVEAQTSLIRPIKWMAQPKELNSMRLSFFAGCCGWSWYCWVWSGQASWFVHYGQTMWSTSQESVSRRTTIRHGAYLSLPSPSAMWTKSSGRRRRLWCPKCEFHCLYCRNILWWVLTTVSTSQYSLQVGAESRKFGHCADSSPTRKIGNCLSTFTIISKSKYSIHV